MSAATNVYGFDFLRTEHTLGGGEGDDAASASSSGDDEDQRPLSALASASAAANIPDASRKNDLEKQADVLHFLQTHRSSGCLLPSVLYRSLGIDLSPDGRDSNVAKMLSRNPKVRVETVPDPENPTLLLMSFGYRATFDDVRDRKSLLARINRCRNGVKMSALLDAYDGVLEDVTSLITGGEVLAVSNPEDRDKVLFPRGEAFWVELDGHVALSPELERDDNTKKKADAAKSKTTNGGNGDKKAKDDDEKAALLREMKRAEALASSNPRHLRLAQLIKTDVDPRRQIRRGEAVSIGSEWFRVSSAIRDDLPLDKQPARAQAPPSVVMLKDLSRKNDADGYVKRFDGGTIPLDRPLSADGIQSLRDAKKARAQLHRIAAGERTGGSGSSGGGGGKEGGGSGAGGHGGGGIRGLTGGAGATLLSPAASAANPANLAGQFASAVAASFGVGRVGGARKRPTASSAAVSAAASASSASRQRMTHDDIKAAIEDARKAASDPALRYSHALRHGCTLDVREMYLATRSDVPSSEHELYKLLLEHKLIEPGEKMSRPRMKRKANVDNDGKPKKRRYYERKGMRRTNTHLDGTEIGALLARAAERQQQGKSVGDGGM